MISTRGFRVANLLSVVLTLLLRYTAFFTRVLIEHPFIGVLFFALALWISFVNEWTRKP